MLVMAPVIGARLISDAYGDRGADYEITPRTIALTRDAIDQNFNAYLENSSDKRQTWSDLVREETEAGRLSSARGLLLAAPVVLNNQDAESLEDFARSSGMAGDDAIETAALRYLAEDAREVYERAKRASLADWLSEDDIEAPVREVSASESPSSAFAISEAQPASTSNVSLNVLGDFRDLSLEGARWIRNDRIDVFAFSLSGLGLTVMDDEARAGASILRSAHRARRLNPDLRDYFEGHISRVAPPGLLRRAFVEGFGDTLAVSNQGEIVENIFTSIADPKALASLEADLTLINDIASETSVFNAITFLESTRGYADLRRARLVARAGGDKAIALARLDPTGVLHTAKTEIPWSNDMRLMLAALASIAIVLCWLAVHTFVGSFRRQPKRRRSAVYALEEPEWLSVDHHH